MNLSEYTPTERKILAVLADGMGHRIEELHACLVETDSPTTNVAPHLTAIRRKLRRIGHTIICEADKRRVVYRHVRLLQSASE